MIPQAADITVLHVDDDPAFSDLVSTFLERTNDRLTVRTAANANEGLEILAEDGIDCIISDYDMPGQNGLEFFSNLRDSGVELPFILFTGKGSEEIASDAISAGVTDYLQKEGGTDQYEILANRVVNSVEKHRAEQRMEQSFDAIETAQEGISILNADGDYIYVNQAYADIFGYNSDEMIGQHWKLIYPEEDIEHTREEILPAVPEEGRWTGETVQVRRDGTRIVVEHSLATSGDHLVCTVRDITEDVEQEKKLREDRELLNLFIHSVEEYAVFMLDPHGNVVSWNPGAEQIIGYTEDEILSEQFSVFYPEESQEAGLPAQLLEQAKADGTTTHEGWRVREDGSKFWGDVTITAVYDESGDLHGFGNLVRDQTTQHEYEQRLTELQQTAQRFIQADSKQEITEISVESATEILDLPINACWLYDDAADVLRPVAASEQSDEVVGDLPVYDGGGSLSWEAFVTGEVGIYDDVTEIDGFDASETPIRSDIVLPLGDYGVMNVGATEPNAFDEIDITLARILTATAEVAMDNVEHQAQLEEETAFFESALNALDDLF